MFSLTELFLNFFQFGQNIFFFCRNMCQSSYMAINEDFSLLCRISTPLSSLPPLASLASFSLFLLLSVVIVDILEKWTEEKYCKEFMEVMKNFLKNVKILKIPTLQKCKNSRRYFLCFRWQSR